MPSPVLVKPLAMKNAATISQTVDEENPVSACAIVSVFVSTRAVMPRMATPLTGSGCAMKPTTVATKIASRCQAFGSIPAGGGANQMAAPIRKTRPS